MTHTRWAAFVGALGVAVVWFIASPIDDLIYAALIAHYAGKTARARGK